MHTDWDKIVEKVNSSVVKIETPDGSGTGFLMLFSEEKAWCGIATALHVVQEADEWQKPIKIHPYDFSKPPLFLPDSERIIFTSWKTDSAVIFFPTPSDLKFPENLIPLRPINSPLPVGAELGWMGFPFLEPFDICFFSGIVSGRKEARNTYMIDGVAVKGVSGGPVIFSSPTDGTQFIGVISSYRAGGEQLPGLLYAYMSLICILSFLQLNQWMKQGRKRPKKKPEKN